ncbi:WD repeat domain-containing protein [Forsythia ovata]|uniref:WD repeat domain-containing protein n=1 Tax=Forsythia ovata TaxID=205694 RepID=A0ABD1WFJ8_9LAMI
MANRGFGNIFGEQQTGDVGNVGIDLFFEMLYDSLSKQIHHDGEVNSARYMPQNPFILVTKTVTAEVYIFHSSKHPSRPPSDTACNPDLRLKGPNIEGYGLSWSQFK